MAVAAIQTHRPHNDLLSALASMSSLDIGADIYDSEEYDTDLEDEREKPDVKPYIGIYAYEKACSDMNVAPQQIVIQGLPQQSMSLQGRNLGPLGMRPVVISLLKNTRVLTLDLSDTGLGDIGATYIAHLLHENAFLCNLNLSQNFIGAQGLYPIAEVLKYNNALIRLNLSYNKIDDLAAELLSETIKMNDRIEELDLSNNEIGLAGKDLGTAIAKNQSIEVLNISWNNLRRDAAVSLIRGVEMNTSITQLDLNHNGLAYDGSLAIGKMLAKNNTLKYLDISCNNISAQGVLLIVPGIKKNKTLEILKLGENPISTTGAMDLIDALSVNTSKISTFSLQRIPVVGEFEMMATAIRQTRPFDYDHGGIVSSHDILGLRYDKQIDPMAKIITYMKERQLRPSELFRSFDKNVGNNLSNDEFITRLQRSGLNMPRYEIEELINHLTRSKVGEAPSANGFNYKNMVKSVKSQVSKDRTEAIRERERKKKIKEYHKKILEQATIPEDSEWQDRADGDLMSIDSKSMSTNLVELLRTASALSLQTKNYVQDTREAQPGVSSPAVVPLPPLNLPNTSSAALFNLTRRGSVVKESPKVISMAGSLGGKVKEFGAHAKKKKKGKRKKSKRH